MFYSVNFLVKPATKLEYGRSNKNPNYYEKNLSLNETFLTKNWSAYYPVAHAIM